MEENKKTEEQQEAAEELTMSEREELEQLRKERDERNIKEKAYDKIYDNLHLSVKSIDIFIAIMTIIFLFVIIKGMGLI